MNLRDTIWQTIENRASEYLDLLSAVIRIPSDNPPGDTTELAQFMRQYLQERQVDVEVYEPLKGAPNLVAHHQGAGPGRHLILNGHLDQFPADPSEPWSFDPYSGEVRDGKVLGRGAGDMKAGTVASLLTFLLLREFAPSLPGRVTLTMVSDEETGGTWGAKWLLENVDGLKGDAVLNGEPSGPGIMWVAEKGICWLKLSMKAAPGHSALGSPDNAITRLARAIPIIYRLNGEPVAPPPGMEPVSAQEPQGSRYSVNIGTIAGGVKANVVAGHAEAEVDIRVPPGTDIETTRQRLEAMLQAEGIEGFTLTPILLNPPSYTDPSAEIIQAVIANGLDATGIAPAPIISYGGSDCRFWRYHGVPAVCYGPRVFNMAAPDEHILASEFLATVKTHVGAALQFLSQ